jgi:hypothetical protein
MCQIDYIRMSDEPFDEERANDEHVESCARGSFAPIVDTFWSLRGGTAIMKYLASGIGGDGDGGVVPYTGCTDPDPLSSGYEVMQHCDSDCEGCDGCFDRHMDNADSR